MTDAIRQFPAVSPDAGVIRQVLADAPELMVVSFSFEEAAQDALHSHPHGQSTFVESGRFRFHLDGEELEVVPGDSFVIPSNATHGCIRLAPERLLDCFTPRRDDFLQVRPPARARPSPSADHRAYARSGAGDRAG